MPKFLSSLLRTSSFDIHFHIEYIHFHLGTSLIIRNLMIIRVTSVEWTLLSLEWPPSYDFVTL